MLNTNAYSAYTTSILSLLLILLLLASCKTTNPDYGSGPITLSPAISNYYKNKYLKEYNPWMFFVNKKGTMASYLKCSSVDCTDEYQHGLELCEKQSGGEKCYIFAEWSTVVWNGNVTWDSHSKSLKSNDNKTFWLIREGSNSAIWYNGESTPTIKIVAAHKYWNRLHERLMEDGDTNIYFAFTWQDKRQKTAKYDYDWIKPVSIKAVKDGYKHYFLISHPDLKQLRSPTKPGLMFGITDWDRGMWFASYTKGVE